MPKLIRMPYSGGLSLTRDELLTPFDSFINDFFNQQMELSKSFPNDFFSKGSYPKVNVADLKDKVVIEAAVPGMDKSDISIEVNENILTLSGKSSQSSGVSDGQYIRRELKRSKFSRSFALGDNLNLDDISATCIDGILTLTVPKKVEEDKEVKARYIDIE